MKDNQNENPTHSGFLGESALGETTTVQRKAGPVAAHATPVAQMQGGPGHTQEEQLASNAHLNASPQTGQNGRVHITGEFSQLVTAFQTAVSGAADYAALQQVVDQHGRTLWDTACARIRASGSTQGDDRPVYVARLQMRTILRNNSIANANTAQLESLIRSLENVSRGRAANQIDFQHPDAGVYGPHREMKKVLISGFDPFFTSVAAQHQLAVSNPSGAAAMALDGTSVGLGGSVAVIEAITVGTRYRDMDDGVIENFFRPYLTGSDRVDMCISLSLDPNTEQNFLIEGYGTANRGGFPDNEGRYNLSPENARHQGIVHGSNIQDNGLATGTSPHGQGAPGHIATTLPWWEILANMPATNNGLNVALRTSFEQNGNPGPSPTAIRQQAIQAALAQVGLTQAELLSLRQAQQGGSATPAQARQIQQFEAALRTHETALTSGEHFNRGGHTPQGPTMPGHAPSGTGTMTRGSGGAYLSNEIFYRIGRLRDDAGSTVPYGHIHVPHNQNNGQFDQSKNTQIADKVREIIQSALPAI